MTALDELVGDATTNADIARAAVTELIEQVMLWVDLLDEVQRGEGRLDIPKLRPKIGKTLRSADARHALAIGALVLDRAPEYAEKLVEYVDELGVEPVEQEGGQ